mmetsp:Transcript_29694/g.53705  ORF Transcript_29694/g.53705 Transcript_29694/m.53705 type:complete len:90 (+) Transcript_29694:369-638(+)
MVGGGLGREVPSCHLPPPVMSTPAKSSPNDPLGWYGKGKCGSPPPGYMCALGGNAPLLPIGELAGYPPQVGCGPYICDGDCKGMLYRSN